MAIGRKRRAGIRAGKFDDALTAATGEVDLVHIRIAALVTGVDEAMCIGTKARRDGDGIVMRELRNIRSIDVCGVDLLFPAAGGDEGDAGAGDAASARECLNDVVGKLMDLETTSPGVRFREGGFPAAIRHVTANGITRGGTR